MKITSKHSWLYTHSTDIITYFPLWIKQIHILRTTESCINTRAHAELPMINAIVTLGKTCKIIAKTVYYIPKITLNYLDRVQAVGDKAGEVLINSDCTSKWQRYSWFWYIRLKELLYYRMIPVTYMRCYWMTVIMSVT